MSDISLENFNRILKHNFNAEFDNWASRANDMSSIDTNSIHKHLSDIKFKKLNYKASNIDFQKQLNDSVKYIADLKGKYDDAIMMKDEIVQINNTPELHGNNWNNLKLSKAGQDLASVVGGKVPARIENDILGYEIDGVFMSTFDIRKMINNSTIDKSSKDVLEGMVEYFKTQAQRERVGELDINELRSKVDSEIVSKGNIHSLKNDKIIETEGGSFKKDFVNNLLSLKRGDLGDIGKSSDKNLNVDEAIAITNELEKDENLEKEQLIDYFATHVWMQYERERSQNPSAIYREDSSVTASSNNNDKDVIHWTPEKESKA